MENRISVLLPTYNREHFLPQALDSVLNQTHPPYEIVVCDDCSTDGTRDIIETYRRKYPNLIKPVLQEKNVGIPCNVNAGLRRVQGDYISLMADDDYYYPRKLELELAAIERSERAQWAYSGVDVVDESGKKLRSYITSANAVEGNIFKEIVLRRISPRHYLMSVKAQRGTGFFDENLLMYEDWDFKIRLSKRSEVVYVPESLTVYRIHEGGIHNMEAEVHLELMNKVVEKTLGLLDDLPVEEAEKIRQGLNNIMLQQRVKYLLDEGKRNEAWKYLLKILTNSPTQTQYYKLAFRSVLPNPLYRLMLRVKHSLRSVR